MRAALSIAIFAFSVGAAIAADAPPPQWDISEACPGAALSGACPRVESDTRRSLLDRWTALPVEFRVTCAKQADAQNERSYRKLAACIDDLAFKAFDDQRRGNYTPAVSATTH